MQRVTGPWLESGLLVVTAPVLLFPTVRPSLTVIALALLVLSWLSALWQRRPWPVTPFNGALLWFAIMVGVGISVTAYPLLTLPKATGLILGLATFRILAGLPPTPTWRRMATLGLIALGSSITLVGLLGAQWYSKVPALSALIARLPPKVLSLPEAAAEGVSANQLAGVVASYWPAALTWLVYTWSNRRYGSGLAASGVTGALGGLLVLTQSRSGWIGGLAGGLFLLAAWLLCVRPRHWQWLLGGGLVGLGLLAGALLTQIGPAQWQKLWSDEAIQSTTELGVLSFSGRVEIWNRALYAIQDFPFTGCGLGTFRQVLWLLYPLFSVPPESDLAHAHNIFLQVALDTGVPGLIAYLALLALAARCAWQVARQQPAWRPLALGVLAGLVSLHVYGLTDALAPGSKPGLIFWAALGLLAALENPALPAARAEQMPESSGEVKG